ncbi:outer membrane porin [hydrothermal vent metagenome]|uniref:Outer membrane porin n=1 Tax=hydrothermal vent metagenome TaxID=652676 RepID=A0A1W1BC60_9ZZZZ
MKKNIIKLTVGLSTIITLSTDAYATLKSDKVTLKNNMTIKYNQLPGSVDSLSAMFKEGIFYGRIRVNTFYWDWDKEIQNKTKDNKAMGVGGSLIYKSAKFSGISTTFGLYTSQNPDFFRMDKKDVAYVKAGKDTFSRYKVQTEGEFGMNVLAQAYLQYDRAKMSIIAGRQLFESVFTQSNDTKMIPNSFDGITITSNDIQNTTIKVGYLLKQKLRDHISSHDVIAYDPNNQNNGNDDSAVNKSLTVDLVGDNNKLIIASITNRSFKNLKTNISYATVPNILSELSLEGHYTIPVGSWKIIPGVRYMMQFDKLHTTTAVANLKGDTTGYKDPNSLDTDLLCARIDFKNGAFLGRLGYSKVADKADIIAPWRAAPTGGFTRAMGQYNWYANTKTYLIRAGYDFSKAHIIPGFSIMARYAIEDFDDNKPKVQADTNILNIDARQNIAHDMELKLRIGLADMKTGSTNKSDLSYNEYRFEINYFF